MTTRSARRIFYEQHHLVRHTDRNGLSFYYEYNRIPDAEWRVARSWGDGGLYNYRFEYIDALQERRLTDSLGYVSVVKLDSRGLPISEIDALGGMTSYEYDENGRTTAVLDPEGHRTEYAYDDRGNLLKLTRPDGKCIQTEFEDSNKPINVTDATDAMWPQHWDSRGLLVQKRHRLAACPAMNTMAAVSSSRSSTAGGRTDLV